MFFLVNDGGEFARHKRQGKAGYHAETVHDNGIEAISQLWKWRSVSSFELSMDDAFDNVQDAIWKSTWRITVSRSRVE